MIYTYLNSLDKSVTYIIPVYNLPADRVLCVQLDKEHHIPVTVSYRITFLNTLKLFSIIP